MLSQDRNGHKRFMVVRDPLVRLLSGYRDKLELLKELSFKNAAREMMQNHRPIKWNIHFYRAVSSEEAVNFAGSMTTGNRLPAAPNPENPYLYPPYPTFREFVAEVLAGWGNPHIVPAAQYCGPCDPLHK